MQSVSPEGSRQPELNSRISWPPSTLSSMSWRKEKSSASVLDEGEEPVLRRAMSRKGKKLEDALVSVSRMTVRG